MVFSLPLTGCSTVLYNAYVSEEGIVREVDQVFGPDGRHRLDVYHPKGTDSSRPVIIFVHGGAWDSGNKDQYYFVARSLVDRGYVAVLPNYRLLPEAKYPDFLWDTTRAVDWTLENIHKFGGQPGNVFLMGHSAGAYNAAMVAYEDRYLEEFGANNGDLRGFIGLAGLYDFSISDDDQLRKVFGSESRDGIRPVEFVDPDDPPALLFHGARDEVINPDNSRSLSRQLNRVGPGAELNLKPKLNHVYLLLSIGPNFRPDYDTLDEIDQFISDRKK